MRRDRGGCEGDDDRDGERDRRVAAKRDGDGDERRERGEQGHDQRRVGRTEPALALADREEELESVLNVDVAYCVSGRRAAATAMQAATPITTPRSGLACRT